MGQGGGPSPRNVSKQEAAPGAGGRGLPVLRGWASLRKCTPFPATSLRPCCLPGLPITPAPADSTGRRTQGSPTASLGHLFSPGSQSPQAHCPAGLPRTNPDCPPCESLPQAPRTSTHPASGQTTGPSCALQSGHLPTGTLSPSLSPRELNSTTPVSSWFPR